jgi:hypothetical protein
MTNPISITDSLTLYRYDRNLPPTVWDATFRNPDYEYSGMEHKNKAGLFFFTDSIDIANSLGKKYSIDNYHLTECKTIKPINIIDFSCCINIFQMVAVLSDLGIYVLNDDFKTYSDKPGPYLKTFGMLKPTYDNLLKGIGNITTFKIEPCDYEDIGFFGQRLTDFDNAESFIKLTKHLGYDGYRWREFDDQRGFTYCLFDAEKLSAPVTKVIPTRN